MHWLEGIQEELLDAEALLRMLPYMTKAFSEDKRNADCRHDPITATVIIFLTCPLQLGLTEVGAMLFQNHSALVYPFSLMTDRQRTFLRGCLERRSEWGIHNGALVFKQPRGEAARTLPAQAVLLALCKKIVEGQPEQALLQRLAVCNIILQRVQGYVPIEKPVQRELNDWLARIALRVA